MSWERLGTPHFSAACFQKREKLQSGSRGRKNHLPRDNTQEHRGVSASSFRDGAILRELETPTFKLACLEKTQTETTEGTKKRGVFESQHQVYVSTVFSAYSVRNHLFVFLTLPNSSSAFQATIAAYLNHKTDRGVVKTTYLAITHESIAA